MDKHRCQVYKTTNLFSSGEVGCSKSLQRVQSLASLLLETTLSSVRHFLPFSRQDMTSKGFPLPTLTTAYAKENDSNHLGVYRSHAADYLCIVFYESSVKDQLCIFNVWTVECPILEVCFSS